MGTQLWKKKEGQTSQDEYEKKAFANGSLQEKGGGNRGVDAGKFAGFTPRKELAG